MEDSETAGVRVRIRQADQSDAGELTRLVHRFNREHSRLIGGRGMHHESNASTEVQSRLKREDTGYFVAVDSTSGRIVAFRRWELHEGFYFTGPLHVTPDLRRSGVARALIRHVERWLLQKGRTSLAFPACPTTGQ